MEPIAKRLKQSAVSAVATAKKPADDIAEQIKRLEAELHGGGVSSGDDGDSSEEDASDDSDSESEVENPKANKKKKKIAAAVLSLSAYADDRVEALPEHLLPKASATAANLSVKRSKRQRESGGDSTHIPNVTAVQEQLLEMMQWPKKVPFACKPCGFVGKDMVEFEAHRASPEHAAKQDTVGGVLMCKLCDKKFTSPQQLEDHKLGKWHLQRTQQRKARHVVKVCYDFMRGHCKFGDRCSFEHTETKAMKSGRAMDKTKKKTCEIFARRGKCKYGDSCLFAHVATES